MKISHFEKPDDIKQPVKKRAGDKDRSGLGALYPTAKTYEQNRQASQRRLQHRISMQPKYPRFKIALCGAAVFGLSIWFVQQIQVRATNINRDESMASIFFAFFLALVLFGLVLWWIKFTNAIFDFAGKTGYLFWSVCGGVALTGIGVGLSGFQNIELARNPFMLTALYSCIVYTAAGIVLKNPAHQ